MVKFKKTLLLTVKKALSKIEFQSTVDSGGHPNGLRPKQMMTNTRVSTVGLKTKH